MIISSWNVNSVRARIINIQEYLKKFSPDILMMQEIKTQEETYPFDDISKLFDEFQAKSYSQLKDDKDEENIKKSLKKILKRIDEYV